MLLKAISSWKASEAPIFWLFPCRLYSRSWPQGRLPQSMQFSKPVIPWYLVDSCGSQASLVVEFRVFHVQQILPVTGHEMLLRSHYPQTLFLYSSCNKHGSVQWALGLQNGEVPLPCWFQGRYQNFWQTHMFVGICSWMHIWCPETIPYMIAKVSSSFDSIDTRLAPTSRLRWKASNINAFAATNEWINEDMCMLYVWHASLYIKEYNRIRYNTIQNNVI